MHPAGYVRGKRANGHGVGFKYAMVEIIEMCDWIICYWGDRRLAVAGTYYEAARCELLA